MPAFSFPTRISLPVLAVLLAGCVALLYGHTLHVPFYLDDNGALVGNYLLRDLPATVGHLFSQRGLTNLTFALNYRLTGWALPSLHLVNLALHLGCGLLFWRLLRHLVTGQLLPLLGALLFLAHPLQTQAVIYVVQRATLLGALFFLLAILCHLRARKALAAGTLRTDSAYLRPWLGALAAGACAVLAKENTAVLPLALFAYDRLFPLPGGRKSWRQELVDYLPFCIVPFLLGVTVLAGQAVEKATGFAHYPLASLQHNGPLNYLVTQFSVMWVYLRLLLLPYGQAFEHDFPVAAQLLTWQSALALAGLLILVWLVWRQRRRRPLLAFGVVWFFLGLAVESSIIPLDPLFEHRLYLPMAGFIMVLLDGVPALIGERRGCALLAVALVVCLPLTWQRNALWNDPVALYEDNLRVVPGSERAMIDLAFRYDEAGRPGDMRRLLEYAVQHRPKNHEFYNALAEDYANREGLEPALALLERGIKLMPDNIELYERAALVAEQHGRPELVFGYLQRGLAAVTSAKWRLLNDLGIYYAAAGDPVKAEQVYRQSLSINADNPVAYQYLGALYYRQGRAGDALAMLREANRLEPGNPETLDGMVKAARQSGNEATARWAAEKLRQAVDEKTGAGGYPP